jgi:hypothetical protein
MAQDKKAAEQASGGGDHHDRDRDRAAGWWADRFTPLLVGLFNLDDEFSDLGFHEVAS